MARVDLDANPGFNRKIARLPGVKAAVVVHAERIKSKAEARLSAHRDTGAAHIEMGHGAVDCTVSLVDKAAMSIEFGHEPGGWYANNVDFPSHPKNYVEGLHIITGAAGLRG